MFVPVVYQNAAVGVNAVNTDLNAATDPLFSQRNSHYTFTNPFKLLGVTLVGASVTRGRFQSSTINGYGEYTIFAANRSATVPSNPYWDWYKDSMIDLPLNEEFQVQVSGNLGASTEVDNAVLLLATPDHNFNINRTGPLMFARATFTVTPTLNAWSGGQAIALSSNLRGGAWRILGAVCQGTNALAWRIIFPTAKFYSGRPLRPGYLVQNAIGDVPQLNFSDWLFTLGEWGRFHTFELPQIEVFGLTAANTTYQVFLLCEYLGKDINLVGQ